MNGCCIHPFWSSWCNCIWPSSIAVSTWPLHGQDRSSILRWATQLFEPIFWCVFLWKTIKGPNSWTALCRTNFTVKTVKLTATVFLKIFSVPHQIIQKCSLMTPMEAPPNYGSVERNTFSSKKKSIEVTKVLSTFDTIDYCARIQVILWLMNCPHSSPATRAQQPGGRFANFSSNFGLQTLQIQVTRQTGRSHNTNRRSVVHGTHIPSLRFDDVDATWGKKLHSKGVHLQM